MLQPLKFGVSVVTSDGRDVGTLYRVVIDQSANRVTAVTVQRRLLESGNLLKPGGWEKPRDLVAPIAAVTGTDEGEVRLSLTEEEVLDLPPYVTAERPEGGDGWAPPREFAVDDVSRHASTLLGGVYEAPREEQYNRGPEDRHLSGGAAVWRRDPHTHLGDLDRLIMDDVSNAVASFTVRRGVIFSHDVEVPFARVVDLLDDLLHVDLPEAEWRALRDYQPAH